MRRRVVITGLGVVAPNGIGKEAFWDACISGRSGIRRITRFDASQMPVQIAGEVRNFHRDALGLTEDECKSLDMATQYAVASANLAMQDAGLANVLSEEEHYHTGVAIGTAMACVDAAEILWTAYTDTGAHPPRIPGGDFILPMQLNTHASAAAVAS